MIKYFLMLVIALISKFEILYAETPYDETVLDNQFLCDGYPRIKNIMTPPGFCVGLVDNGILSTSKWGGKTSSHKLLLPRSVIEVDKNKFFLVDQGSKNSLLKNGQIFLIEINDGKAKRYLIANKETNPYQFPNEAFIRPSHIAKFGDRIYFSTTRDIFSFKFENNEVVDIKVEISNIQNQSDPKVLNAELHPIKIFLFDDLGNLIVNVGSQTNNCRTSISKSRNEDCEEARNQAQLRKYLRNRDGSYSSIYKIIAYGLRNSMTMAFHPVHSKWLFQGENSRDSINALSKNKSKNSFGDGKTLPEEELNFMDLSLLEKDITHFNFGWPYCYGNNFSSPEYPLVNCKNKDEPFQLLPAHAAPLGMVFHSGHNWPEIFTRVRTLSD